MFLLISWGHLFIMGSTNHNYLMIIFGMESMEEAGRGEEEGEEEEEESLKELEPEEEEIAMATGAGGLGFFCATWLWRKMSLP